MTVKVYIYIDNLGIWRDKKGCGMYKATPSDVLIVNNIDIMVTQSVTYFPKLQ